MAILLTTYAVAAFIVGLLAFVAPYHLIPGDLALGPGGVLIAQAAGAYAIGLGLIAFLGRRAKASRARDAMLLGFMASEAITVLVYLLHILYGTITWPSWGLVLIPLAFVVAFAYALFVRPGGCWGRMRGEQSAGGEAGSR